MKLPNGYGSIYRLSGNRRLPWTIRITLSCNKDSSGKRKWKYQYLGYYATPEEALTHLVHLHDSVNETVLHYQPTFEQVFHEWSYRTYPMISQSNIRGYNAAYKLCEELYGMPFNSITRNKLQSLIDTCGKNYPMLKKLKILFSSLYKYAIQNDICIHDYSRHLNIRQYQTRNPNELHRSPFTPEELSLLWSHSADHECQIILMLIYTGCRISELLQLEKKHIHLDKKYFLIEKSKTRSGRRIVPIAEKIYPFFYSFYINSPGIYFISDKGHDFYTYQHYYNYHWKQYLSTLRLDHHMPHETRHTCVTLLTLSHVDDKLIKKIIGHAGTSITEKVYTHFDLEQLATAINLI